MKGFSLKSPDIKIILDSQRLRHCEEFVGFFEKEDTYENGVLFTGPIGVGKSSICLATFMTCFVRELPVVYIPRCDLWEKASRTEQEAQIYFMRAFFKQNADLIEKDSQLVPFFEDQLIDDKVDPINYIRFCEAVREQRVRRCGFIADEVQKLTLAATDLPGNREPKVFFSTDFTIWTGPSGDLPSQQCSAL